MSQSQPTAKESEALDVVRFFTRNEASGSASTAGANLTEEPSVDGAKNKNSDSSKQVGENKKPRRNRAGEGSRNSDSQAPRKTIERSTVPKARISPHEVGIDIPKRLRAEWNHRLDNNTKATIAQITDEALHLGLEQLERRRKKRPDTKGETT